MKNNAFILRGVLVIGLILLLANFEAIAQCPMCKISLESNLKNGGTQGRGINAGILYLLVTPYLLVGAIAYFWWRNRKKKEDYDLEDELNTVPS